MLFTRPFSSHVCFLEMPNLWEDSEVMRSLEIWRDQEIHKQFEGSTPKKKRFEIISARLALVDYTDNKGILVHSNILQPILGCKGV